MATTLRASLALDALEMAIWTRQEPWTDWSMTATAAATAGGGTLLTPLGADASRLGPLMEHGPLALSHRLLPTGGVRGRSPRSEAVGQ